MNTAIIILAITIICRKTDNKLCMTCECIGFYCERDLWKNSEKRYDNQKKRKKNVFKLETASDTFVHAAWYTFYCTAAFVVEC